MKSPVELAETAVYYLRLTKVAMHNELYSGACRLKETDFATVNTTLEIALELANGLRRT